ncbi:MAG: membrane dipeptidase, partial [Candidatus Korobacteraceae bacterium]
MNSRRTFLVTLGRAMVVASLAPQLVADAAEQFSPEIADLYRKSVVIDTLCAPFTSADTLPDKTLVEVVRRSGITAINFTISARSFDETIENLAYVDALVEQSPDVFMVVRQQSDITRAKRDSKIGIMPGFQYTQFLEADPSRIETFRRLGVRIMQITYNNRSD